MAALPVPLATRARFAFFLGALVASARWLTLALTGAMRGAFGAHAWRWRAGGGCGVGVLSGAGEKTDSSPALSGQKIIAGNARALSPERVVELCIEVCLLAGLERRCWSAGVACDIDGDTRAGRTRMSRTRAPPPRARSANSGISAHIPGGRSPCRPAFALGGEVCSLPSAPFLRWSCYWAGGFRPAHGLDRALRLCVVLPFCLPEFELQRGRWGVSASGSFQCVRSGSRS